MPSITKKILITGGHLSPAMAVLPELLSQNYQIIFIGRKSAFSNQTDISLEYQLLSKERQIKFISLQTGRLTKGSWIGLPREIMRFVYGLFKSLEIIRQEKPNIVLTFGGYLALPIGLASACFKIPIYLHEQTAFPGKANRLLAHFATKIGVALPQSQPYFPSNKTKLIGMILRPQLKKNPTTPNWFTSRKPLLLVTGGSTGAHLLNRKIAPILPELSKSFSIVHQTGENEYHDYEELKKLALSDYFPRKYLLPEEMGYLLNRAILIISRSGANTFFEIIKYQKPAVLIPLSLAEGSEQLKQAQILKNAGVAEIILENHNSEELKNKIVQTAKQREKILGNFQKLASYAKLIINEKQFLKEFGL